MKAWGAGGTRKVLIDYFSNLLGQEWIFESFDRHDGEMRWVKQISENYLFRLGVHPTSSHEDGYNFQTRIYFYSPGIVQVGEDCQYIEVVPSDFIDIFKTKGLILGTYVEGLEKYLSKLDIVRLKRWNPDQGVVRSKEWLDSIDLYFSFIGDRLKIPEQVSDALIEISELDKLIVPTPFCLHFDPFISAASAELIVGRKDQALYFLMLGKSKEWMHNKNAPYYAELIQVSDAVAAHMILKCEL
jgi:hypothetical protein